ncbi:MAG: hypothetical protein IJQ53_01705 [Clostridia bacterium]|nr:hypothetical protein [Clostridia bacterium]
MISKNDIIELIPSKDLKEAIKRESTKFSDLDLIVIANECSPTLIKKHECWESIALTADDSTARSLRCCIEHENKAVTLFEKPTQGTVYHALIMLYDANYSKKVLYDEAICASLSAAKRFFCDVMNDTDAPDNSNYKFIINKEALRGSGVEQGIRFSEFSSGVIAEAEFNEEGEYVDITDFINKCPFPEESQEHCRSISVCSGCTKTSYFDHEVDFPVFWKNRDIIKIAGNQVYLDYDVPVKYGVALSACSDDSYIYTLFLVPDRKYAYELFDYHQHVPAQIVELSSYEELDEIHKQAYNDIINRLDSDEKYAWTKE